MLSGTEEALLERQVDLAICSQVPPGFAGDFADAVALHRGGASGSSAAPARARAHAAGSAQAPSSGHSRYGQPAPQRQLARRRTELDGEPQSHLDPRRRDGAWVSPGIRRRRCAASSTAAPSSRCRCAKGGERWGNLYLVFADRDYAGPGALRLAEIIRESRAAVPKTRGGSRCDLTYPRCESAWHIMSYAFAFAFGGPAEKLCLSSKIAEV